MTLRAITNDSQNTPFTIDDRDENGVFNWANDNVILGPLCDDVFMAVYFGKADYDSAKNPEPMKTKFADLEGKSIEEARDVLRKKYYDFCANIIQMSPERAETKDDKDWKIKYRNYELDHYRKLLLVAPEAEISEREKEFNEAVVRQAGAYVLEGNLEKVIERYGEIREYEEKTSGTFRIATLDDVLRKTNKARYEKLMSEAATLVDDRIKQILEKEIGSEGEDGKPFDYKAARELIQNHEKLEDDAKKDVLETMRLAGAAGAHDLEGVFYAAAEMALNARIPFELERAVKIVSDSTVLSDEEKEKIIKKLNARHGTASDILHIEGAQFFAPGALFYSNNGYQGGLSVELAQIGFSYKNWLLGLNLFEVDFFLPRDGEKPVMRGEGLGLRGGYNFLMDDWGTLAQNLSLSLSVDHAGIYDDSEIRQGVSTSLRLDYLLTKRELNPKAGRFEGRDTFGVGLFAGHDFLEGKDGNFIGLGLSYGIDNSLFW